MCMYKSCVNIISKKKVFLKINNLISCSSRHSPVLWEQFVMRWQMLWGWHSVARRRSWGIRARYRWHWINTWAKRTSIWTATLISIRSIARVWVGVIRLNNHSISGVRTISCYSKFSKQLVSYWTCKVAEKKTNHSDLWNCRCSGSRRCLV